MSVAGLGTYSSTNYFYAGTRKGRSKETLAESSSFGKIMSRENEDTPRLKANKDETIPSAPYTRCITASIKSEEMVASQTESGEMIYSYCKSEQSFQIYINSDGENKTYKINGFDKDGYPFEKEFDPYDVNPEDADFPEFSALCMYIRQTDETADLLANDYFGTDDILEKKNYLGMLTDFRADSIFEKAQSMLDCAARLVDGLNKILDIRTGIESAMEPYRIQLLTMNAEEETEGPVIPEKVGESLSSKIVNATENNSFNVIPLGLGFANAGRVGYGMSAWLPETQTSNDVIVKVQISTGDGGFKNQEVNLSEFDPKNATAVEMFAYCQYQDAIGNGSGHKWGSWNAVKSILSPLDGMDFGSLENILTQKMDWTEALSKSETTLGEKGGEAVSAAELLEMFEEQHRLTAEGLKESDDWRDMSEDEWDKMLAGIDKYIDAFKERLEEMRKLQMKASQKAASEASPDRKAIAASEAALAAASTGLEGGVSSKSRDEETTADGDPGHEYEKNWTRILNTDDQTVLRVAKEAQAMENSAARRAEEIRNGNAAEYSSYEAVSVVYRDELFRDDQKEPLRLIAMDGNGIRCINDTTSETEWEINFRNEAQYRRAADAMARFGRGMDFFRDALDREEWIRFLR
ncbi:MAG: hypothetical protein K6G83_13750 [Lachnospiraceae bacterium]|nr:hypothetical protein [Lachnospiraceae bacterium]